MEPRYREILPQENIFFQFTFGSAGSLLLRGLSLVAAVSGGDSPVVECRLLTMGGSLIAEHRLQGAWASVVVAPGL